MLDSKGFDLWADGFDKSVGLSDEDNTYPFAGYKAILRPDGAILIGDVMFKTRADLTRCRERAGEEWNDEEIYFVTDELRDAIPGAEFTKISHCAGILTIKGE